MTEDGSPCREPGKGSEVRETRIEKAIAEVLSVNPFVGRDVPEVGVPVRPKLNPRVSTESQLRSLQKFIEQFQYNFLPRTFFNCYKYRSLNRILETAREVMREALPIRCLEATYLAILLTQEMKDVERFPLTFKTSFQGQLCRHIVLAVRAGPPSRSTESWGALGLSRKEDLMYKRLGGHQSLAHLVQDYEAAYERHGHELLAVKVGLPISHNSMSATVPCWRFLCLSLKAYARDEVWETLDQYSAMALRLAEEWEKQPNRGLNGSMGKLKKKLSLPRPATAAATATAATSEATDEVTVGELEEEDLLQDSDEAEESTERVRCILANRSPFRRNQFTSPVLYCRARSTSLNPAPPAPRKDPSIASPLRSPSK